MPCDSRLVAVLSFMRRILTRVVRPPTLLKAAMQALDVADIKLGEGEVNQSDIDFHIFQMVQMLNPRSKGADLSAATIQQLANRKASE